MFGLGVAAWIGSWFLAYHASDRRAGRAFAVRVVAGAAILYAAFVGATWAIHGGARPFHEQQALQLGLLGLYFLAYGLIPAAIGRLFNAPRLAVAIAVLLPIAAVGVGHGRPVSDGIGHLGDLLFLSPVEMGEGVTRDGHIPHRFRVHWFALGALVLVGLAAQLPGAQLPGAQITGAQITGASGADDPQ